MRREPLEHKAREWQTSAGWRSRRVGVFNHAQQLHKGVAFIACTAAACWAGCSSFKQLVQVAGAEDGLCQGVNAGDLGFVSAGKTAGRHFSRHRNSLAAIDGHQTAVR